MISYADLERAINRWKVRKSGQSTTREVEAMAEAIAEPLPDESYDGAPGELAGAETPSGHISIGDTDIEREEGT